MGMAMLVKALGLPEGSTLEDVAEALKIGSDASVVDVVAAIVAALDAMAEAETEASDAEEMAASEGEDKTEASEGEGKTEASEGEDKTEASEGEKVEASAVRRLIQREMEKGERRALLSAARSMGVKPAELALLASASIKSVRTFVNARKGASASKKVAPAISTRTVKLSATSEDLREFARGMRMPVEAVRKQFGG